MRGDRARGKEHGSWDALRRDTVVTGNPFPDTSLSPEIRFRGEVSPRQPNAKCRMQNAKCKMPDEGHTLPLFPVPCSLFPIHAFVIKLAPLLCSLSLLLAIPTACVAQQIQEPPQADAPVVAVPEVPPPAGIQPPGGPGETPHQPSEPPTGYVPSPRAYRGCYW